MALKHYFGILPSRMACCQEWRGGHFFTANERLQRRIERHPYFRDGRIEIIDDEADANMTERSTDVDPDAVVKRPNWDVYIRGLSWNELRALAGDRGISVFGKKAVDLIGELIELGE